MLRNNYLYTEKYLSILKEPPDLREMNWIKHSFNSLADSSQPYIKTVYGLEINLLQPTFQSSLTAYTPA